VQWESSTDEHVLNAARWEIARSVAWGLGEEPPAKNDPEAVLAYLQGKAPPVYDPFCGGGSIPLEAQRLGLRAYGSDLNPVAVLISKALVEIPPKFAGRPPVNPDRDPHRAWKGAQGLAEDVRYYGRWMRDQAEKRIGHLYPPIEVTAKMAAGRPDLEPYVGQKLTVIAWLWARTVASPDPMAKGAHVPLVSSFMLSTKKGKKAWVEVIRDPTARDGWRFEVETGNLTAEEEKRLKEGTIARSGGGKCVLTNAPMPFTYIREKGKTEGLSVRLMAIVAEGQRGRVYLSPDSQHETTALIEKPDVRELQMELPDNPRDFKTPNYGLAMWSDLFTARQLTALKTFSDLVGEARERVLADAHNASLPSDERSLADGGVGAVAYADAVTTYLAFSVTNVSDRNASIVGWANNREHARNVFVRQALPMVWDFCESNVFSESSGNYFGGIEKVYKALSALSCSGSGTIKPVAAQDNSYGEVLSIATDPPYYDNIGYADLSDFFYVWLRRCLRTTWPELFRRLLTPKETELVH